MPAVRRACRLARVRRGDPMTTPLITPSSTATVDDGPAIAELHRLHAVQGAAFLADPYPDTDTRKGHLAALAWMVMGRRGDIRDAMRTDIALHPERLSAAALGSSARHRQPGDRPRGCASGGGQPRPRYPGTWRQVPGHPGGRQR